MLEFRAANMCPEMKNGRVHDITVEKKMAVGRFQLFLAAKGVTNGALFQVRQA